MQYLYIQTKQFLKYQSQIMKSSFNYFRDEGYQKKNYQKQGNTIYLISLINLLTLYKNTLIFINSMGSSPLSPLQDILNYIKNNNPQYKNSQCNLLLKDSLIYQTTLLIFKQSLIKIVQNGLLDDQIQQLQQWFNLNMNNIEKEFYFLVIGTTNFINSLYNAVTMGNKKNIFRVD
ncbi:hypothetical protein pb186bvf_016709 [Paramecium bursaria]